MLPVPYNTTAGACEGEASAAAGSAAGGGAAAACTPKSRTLNVDLTDLLEMEGGDELGEQGEAARAVDGIDDEILGGPFKKPRLWDEREEMVGGIAGVSASSPFSCFGRLSPLSLTEERAESGGEGGDGTEMVGEPGNRGGGIMGFDMKGASWDFLDGCLDFI
ncbi:unnamed protein product [Closterium sp. NIES-54]